MSQYEYRCESPLGFYQRVVGEGDLRRWSGDRVAALLQSFEVSYSGYLRRFSAGGGAVESNDGFGGIGWIRESGLLGSRVCGTVGSDVVGQERDDTGRISRVAEVVDVVRDQDADSVESGVISEKPVDVVPLFGPNGGISVGRKENYARNQAARSRKKLVKQGKLKRGGVKVENVELQRSLEKKWQAENALAERRALQQLELLEARNMGDMKRMQRAQTMRTTELCKVQTERAFASLKRTGNVPGFAETVVSDPSLTEGSTARSDGDCISPDSSVSQQEIRQMQKDILELTKEKEDANRYMEKVKQTDMKVHLHAYRIAGEKTAYTMDTEGEIAIDAEGDLGEDGKIHVALGSRVLPNFCYKQKYRNLEEDEW